MLRESESMRLAWFAAWCEVLRKQRAGKVKNPAGVLRWLLDRPSVMAVYATASSEEKARSLLRRLAAQFHK
jgi:aryl-alcohol dehydrogenase-like predicted oxidoreductase